MLILNEARDQAAETRPKLPLSAALPLGRLKLGLIPGIERLRPDPCWTICGG
jgi:hypothetical protein